MKLNQMEQNFNEQDSFRIINEMIVQAKGNFQKGVGDRLLLWGYAVAIISILCFCLPLMSDIGSSVFWLWTLTIPVAIINFVIQKRKAYKAIVTTQLEKTAGIVWTGMLITSLLFIAFLFMVASAFQTSIPFLFITPMMLVFSGVGLFVTSNIYKFKPFFYGACIFLIASIVCMLHFVFFRGIDFEFIILALAMIFGFIIPGHILNKKAESYV